MLLDDERLVRTSLRQKCEEWGCHVIESDSGAQTARGGHRWAFLAGMVLYGADMIALALTFSIWAFGVHAFFVFKWFQEQKALRDLHDPGAATF